MVRRSNALLERVAGSVERAGCGREGPGRVGHDGGGVDSPGQGPGEQTRERVCAGHGCSLSDGYEIECPFCFLLREQEGRSGNEGEGGVRQW